MYHMTSLVMCQKYVYLVEMFRKYSSSVEMFQEYAYPVEVFEEYAYSVGTTYGLPTQYRCVENHYFIPL